MFLRGQLSQRILSHVHAPAPLHEGPGRRRSRSRSRRAVGAAAGPGTCEGIPYRYEKAPAPTRFNTGTVARAYAALCGRLARECDALIVIVQSRRALKRCADAVHRAGGRVVFELNENPGSIRASRLDTPLSLRIERWNYLHRAAAPRRRRDCNFPPARGAGMPLQAAEYPERAYPDSIGQRPRGPNAPRPRRPTESPTCSTPGR